MNMFLNTSNFSDIEIHKENYASGPLNIGDQNNRREIIIDTRNKGSKVLINGRIIVKAGSTGAVVTMNIYNGSIENDPIDIIEMPVNADSMESIDLFSYEERIGFKCKKQRFIITLNVGNGSEEADLRGYTIGFFKFS